jgi:hypothetical protein
MMSVQQRGSRWVVRWREGGRHHARAFADRKDAVVFDRGLRSADDAARAVAVMIDNLDEAGLRGAASRIQARLEAT